MTRCETADGVMRYEFTYLYVRILHKLKKVSFDWVFLYILWWTTKYNSQAEDVDTVPQLNMERSLCSSCGPGRLGDPGELWRPLLLFPVALLCEEPATVQAV